MPAQHALVFSGASSVANYQALLQQVQFQSSSDNPTDFSHSPQRTLTWAVTDSASVTTATTTINIVAVNDAPQETVAATAAYTENGSPVTISPAATASDVDNSDLIYGGVRIVAGGFDGDVLTVNGLQSGTFARHRLFLRCRLAAPSVRKPGRGRGLPGAHAGGPIRVDQRESDELRRQSDAHAGVGFVRRRGLQFLRADDADHHHRPERRPGQHRAGRADRRRGHHPADRRRLGGGHRQQRAHHHAVGRSRHPQCDRRPRRHRQRHRQRNHHRHGSADQRGARGPRLYRQPQLQRRRHASRSRPATGPPPTPTRSRSLSIQ